MIYLRENALQLFRSCTRARRSVMIGSFYWTVSWYIWKHAFYFMLDLARASFFNYDV